MPPGNAASASAAPTSPDALRHGEELVRLRAGSWRLLLPMRFVERIHGAAMPVARPSAGAPEAPVVALGPDELVPVVFAESLLGAAEVRLGASQQMILLGDGERRAILWVDAAEDVVDHVPRHAPAPQGGPDGLVAGWSGETPPLAVLDVPRLLDRAAGTQQRKEAP